MSVAATFFLLCGGLAQAQDDNSQISELLAICGEYYGTNDELVNGSIYQTYDQRITGHPYLFSNQWQTGAFFIKSNSYHGLSVKYDLVQETFVLHVSEGNSNSFQIDVNSGPLDSVVIGNRVFINSKLFLPDSIRHSFYESVYQGRFFVGRRYEKRFIDLYNNSNPHGRFSDQRISLHFFYSGNQSNITKEKSLLEIFGVEERKKIKSYIKQKGINYKKASLEQFSELFNYVSQVVAK